MQIRFITFKKKVITLYMLLIKIQDSVIFLIFN